MSRNLVLMLDEVSGTERLIDSLGSYFNATKTNFEAAFVDDCCSAELRSIFNPIDIQNSQFSGEEIFEKVFHANGLNSEESISRMLEKCQNISLKALVYLNEHKINNSVFSACQYKDLVVIGDAFVATNKVEKLNFFDKLLHFTNCPVLLLAGSTDGAKDIILVFDGSLNSINAIKAFVYLMPDYLKKCKVFLNILVNEKSIEDEKEMVAYLKNYKQNFAIQHYFEISGWGNLLQQITYTSNFLMVSGIDRSSFASHVLDCENAINLSKQNISFFIA